MMVFLRTDSLLHKRLAMLDVLLSEEARKNPPADLFSQHGCHGEKRRIVSLLLEHFFYSSCVHITQCDALSRRTKRKEKGEDTDIIKVKDKKTHTQYIYI
jgi:hypothetical protein